MTQQFLTFDGRIGVTVSRSCGVSTIIATALESERIQSTCSADDVS